VSVATLQRPNILNRPDASDGRGGSAGRFDAWGQLDSSAAATDERAAPEGVEAVDPRPARKTVLVVDDEEMLRILVELTLERGNYRVLTAANGQEGLERARTEQPDLILMDVTMPVLDGLDACRRLKADPATSSIPVVMLSARVQPEDRAAGLAAGADDYLMKPFRPAEFLAYLGRRLRGE
jgi:CheY-like chemotaxis protein